jgi:cell filamentation protein, protein adenylyltransferase
MPEDPYSDPVTGVLYNKLGLGTAAGLEAAEREITHAALILVDESPVSPSYDLPHLQEIHKRIFGDIYEWAGQIRTVAIAKGAMFCLPQYIDSSAAVIFGELHDEDCLRGLRRDAFVGRLAHYLGEVNALNPFRERNGRAQRAFFGQLARDAGPRLPGSTLIPPATSRPPPRSCVATPNRCARCWTRSPGTAPDHPSYARRQA